LTKNVLYCLVYDAQRDAFTILFYLYLISEAQLVPISSVYQKFLEQWTISRGI